ncbi:MAG: hypothetical protein NT154_03225 [Verrucomicrobia bacterium]|nr:hypothetical protein [Verrucomicrobiota bacterium]
MNINAKRRKPETVKVGNVTVKIHRRQKTIKGKLKDCRDSMKMSPYGLDKNVPFQRGRGTVVDAGRGTY